MFVFEGFLTVISTHRAAGGDLQTVLDSEEFLDEFICREILRDTLCGLQFLHSHSIAHLDIKVKANYKKRLVDLMLWL